MPDATTIAEVSALNVEPVRSYPTRPPATLEKKVTAVVDKKKVEKEPNTVMRQHSAIESGDPFKPIHLKPEARDRIIAKLIKRSEIAQDLKEKQRPLTEVDNMLLRSDFLERLQRGDLVEEDVVLAWFEMKDEYILKSMAAARQVHRDPSRFASLRNLPLAGRLVGNDVSTILPTGFSDADFSEYIKEIGYDTFNAAKIEKDLRDLDQLRQELEKSFYRNGMRHPMVDRFRSFVRGGPPLYQEPIWGDVREDFLSESGHKFYDEMGKQISAVIAEKYPGIADFAALPTDLDRLKVEHFAVQRALAQKARKYALEIVNGEARQTNVEAITQRATEARTPIKAEDLTPLQEAKTKADTELSDAKIKLTRLEAELKRLKEGTDDTPSELTAKTQLFDHASDKLQKFIDNIGTVDLTAGTSTGQFAKIDHEILELETKRGGVGGGTPASAAELKTINESIKDLLKERTTLLNQLLALIDVKADTERNKIIVEQRIQALEGVPLPPGVAGPVVPGEIDQAKTRVTTTEAAAKNAADKLNKKGEEVETGRVSLGGEEKAVALEREALLAESRSEIHNLLYSQAFGGEFTIEMLADSTLTNGKEVVGAEAIRKLLFQTIDKKTFTPQVEKLARKMFSDEILARAMLDYFGIDLTRTITVPLAPGVAGPGAVTISYQDMIDRVTTQKHPGRKSAEAKILLQHSITHLQLVHQSEISHFLNRVMDKMLESAELGNPFLTTEFLLK